MEKTNEQNIEARVKEVNPDLTYVCGYTSAKSTSLLINSKYGLICTSWNNLKRLNKKFVPFRLALNKTEFCNNELKDLHYFIQLIEEYKPKRRLKFQTQYGIVTSTREELLRGVIPTIDSAINKTAYFKNSLTEKFPDLELVGDYTNKRNGVLVRDQYGIMKVNPSDLMTKNKSIGIQAAVDKTLYCKNRIKEIYPSLLFDDIVYIDSYHKIKLKCQVHGNFLVDPREAMSYKKRRVISICPICSFVSKYVNQTKSKGNCILYCFKFKNETEEFYKWGVSTNSIEYRYNSPEKCGGYSNELIYSIDFKTSKEAVMKEQEIHAYHKMNGYHYKPNNYFAGSVHECSTLSPLNNQL